MKTLYLLRHAKSSWKNLEISDMDRPLKGKGVMHAYHMAEKLKTVLSPDLVLCSPAARTLHTASIFLRKLNIDFQKLQVEPVLYQYSSSQEIVQLISSLPDHIESVAIVGHNPSMHELSELLSFQELEGFSTGSLAKIDFNISTWSELPQKGNLSYFEDKSLLL